MKKSLLLFGLIILISKFLSAQAPTNGLVGYWPFNGNAKDASGNGNNGTVSGALTKTDRFGKDSTAYLFDGIDDYIQIKGSKSMNLMGSYTFSAWISPNGWGEDSTQGFGRIMDKSKIRLYLNKISVTGTGFSYTDHSLVNAITNSATDYVSNNIQYSIAQNVWQHVAVSVTLNGSSNKCEYYVNGNSVGTYFTQTLPNSIDSNLNDDLFIGNRSIGGRAFKGKIDDVYLYNRALTSNEINMVFRENLRVKYTDTTYKIDTIKYSTTDTLFIKLNKTGIINNQIQFANLIKVYPNPAISNINLDFGSNYAKLSKYSVKIISTSGSEIYNSLIFKKIETVDLKSFSGTGLYFIQVLDENNKIIETKKVVLQ